MYLVKYIKEMNEIEHKQSLFLLFWHFHSFCAMLLRYDSLIDIPVANNIYCLTIAAEENQDILSCIFNSYWYLNGVNLPLFACKNKRFKLISKLDIAISQNINTQEKTKKKKKRKVKSNYGQY